MQIAKPPWKAVCGESVTLRGASAAPLLPKRAEKEQISFCEEEWPFRRNREGVGMLSFLGGPGAGAGVTHVFAYLLLWSITVPIF